MSEQTKVSEKELNQLIDQIDRMEMKASPENTILENFLVEMGIEFLKEEEQDLLDFLLYCIEHFRALYGKTPLDLDELMQRSEENMETYKEYSSQDFDKYLDLCFQETPEEELLALVEDSTSEYPKEIMVMLWVICKSVIDYGFASS